MQRKDKGDLQLMLVYHLSESGTQQIQQIIKAVGNMRKQQGKMSTYSTLKVRQSPQFGFPGNQICNGKYLVVGSQKLNVRKWFSDFQIFINKLNESLTIQDVRDYFSKFGTVLQVEITDAHQEPDSKIVNRHCYIKLDDEQSVNQCIIYPKHIINQHQIKVARTYAIGENEETDRRIFIKIQPSPLTHQAFETLLNKQLSKCGTLREKIRVEPMGQFSRATATFINNQSYQKALATYNLQKIQDYTLILRPFISKEGSFRIFLSNIKPEISENDLQSVIQSIFGKIVDVSFLINRKTSLKNAVVNFAEEKSMKRALTEYKEHKSIQKLFAGEPYITIHMNIKQRKQYTDFTRKNQNIQKFSNNPPEFGFGPRVNQMNPLMNPMMNPIMNPMMNPMMNQMNPMGQFVGLNNNMRPFNVQSSFPMGYPNNEQ